MSLVYAAWRFVLRNRRQHYASSPRSTHGVMLCACFAALQEKEEDEVAKWPNCNSKWTEAEGTLAPCIVSALLVLIPV